MYLRPANLLGEQGQRRKVYGSSEALAAGGADALLSGGMLAGRAAGGKDELANRRLEQTHTLHTVMETAPAHLVRNKAKAACSTAAMGRGTSGGRRRILPTCPSWMLRDMAAVVDLPGEGLRHLRCRKVEAAARAWARPSGGPGANTSDAHQGRSEAEEIVDPMPLTATREIIEGRLTERLCGERS